MRLLKPGGKFFASTINRTPAAFALAIVGAEYVARLLPKGTHDYSQFIRPSEFAAWLRAAGLSLVDVRGPGLRPDPAAWAVCRALTAVNYLVHAEKPLA
jgi:2-polyprenyl-6-hydroxyphenyl methylase/3-demethylubiquinone-9 3-methyltransferase